MGERERDYLSKVTTWQMSPEELATYRKKYPPKMPLKDAPKAKNWNRITKDLYLKHRRKGLSKAQIISRHPGTTMDHLNSCIKRWGIEE